MGWAGLGAGGQRQPPSRPHTAAASCAGPAVSVHAKGGPRDEGDPPARGRWLRARTGAGGGNTGMQRERPLPPAAGSSRAGQAGGGATCLTHALPWAKSRAGGSDGNKAREGSLHFLCQSIAGKGKPA